jgi:hypothetical protein
VYFQWGTDGAFVVSQIEVKCKIQESCSAVIGRIFVQFLETMTDKAITIWDRVFHENEE